MSSDTWFHNGGLLGVTQPQNAELHANGTTPPSGPGFAYFNGLEGALFEIAGDYPDDRINHIHMWQDELLCVQLWYQKHFNSVPRAGFGDGTVTETDCKVLRATNRTFPALKREGMYRAHAAALPSAMWI